jgi:hypothetical protein
MATVIVMETVANKIGVLHRESLNGAGILTPAENSDINTATSVSASSSADSLSGLK